jgi:hypothetical protein
MFEKEKREKYGVRGKRAFRGQILGIGRRYEKAGLPAGTGDKV